VNVAVPVTVAGVVALKTGTGVATLSGSLNGAGTINLTGVLDGGATVAPGASVTVNGGTLTAFEKRGAGELTLGGSAALVGGSAQVGAGTLKVVSEKTLEGVRTLEVGTATNSGSGAILDVSQVSDGLVVGGRTVGQVLKGRGTVRGIVKLSKGAILAPGNSPGTQKIQGNLEVGSGAIYQVEYTMSGTLNDLLQVVAVTGSANSGAVVLNGGIVDPKVYRGAGTGGNLLTKFGKSHRIKILETEKGVTGQFEGVRQSAALRATLIYTDSSGTPMKPVAARSLGASGIGLQASHDPLLVYLELERNAYASLGKTQSQKEVGHGLDLLVAAAAYDKAVEEIIAQFDTLQLPETQSLLVPAAAPAGAAAAAGAAPVVLSSGLNLSAALDAVFPKAFAEMYTLSLSRVQDVQKTVSDRLNLLGMAATSVSQEDVLSLATGVGGEWNAWTNGYASFRAKSANPAAGEGGSSVNAYGDVTGVERRFGRATFGMLGGAGTASTQINLPNSSVRSTSWHMGMYMSVPVGQRLFADVSGFYGEAENVIRQTQRAFSSGTLTMLPGRAFMETQEWLLQGGVGGQLARPGSRWSLVPSVRFAYTGMHFGKSRVEGVGPLGIRSDSTWNATVLSRAGMDIAKEGRIGRLPVRVTGSAAWVHDFMAESREMSVAWRGLEAGRWNISSGRNASDTLRLGGAVEFGIGERRTLRLYGEQEFLQGRNVLRGGVNFTIGF
jgi:hypothetical protein